LHLEAWRSVFNYRVCILAGYTLGHWVRRNLWLCHIHIGVDTISGSYFTVIIALHEYVLSEFGLLYESKKNSEKVQRLMMILIPIPDNAIHTRGP
jgi:hypothetical protein